MATEKPNTLEFELVLATSLVNPDNVKRIVTRLTGGRALYSGLGTVGNGMGYEDMKEDPQKLRFATDPETCRALFGAGVEWFQNGILSTWAYTTEKPTIPKELAEFVLRLRRPDDLTRLYKPQ